MKIFIICCLLFIHVNMCIFIHGFRVSAGLVLVMDFHPNRFRVRIRVSISGFGFGCTETPPDPNPTRCHSYRRLARGSPARRWFGWLAFLCTELARGSCGTARFLFNCPILLTPPEFPTTTSPSPLLSPMRAAPIPPVPRETSPEALRCLLAVAATTATATTAEGAAVLRPRQP